MNAFEFADMNELLSMIFVMSWSSNTFDVVMNDENVQKLLKSDEKFDAVIVEVFAIDGLLGLGQHFNCPVIGVSTFDGVYWQDIYTANQSPYSYVPMMFANLPERMNFQQRLFNLVVSEVEKFIYTFYHLRNQRRQYEKYFPLATKSFDEALKSMSILFTNSHVSSSSARPTMPNMIGINGIHIDQAKPLPKDIQTFLDSASDGVLLFSMGSVIQSKDWTTQQREILVKTFSKLNQKVLWKYENETLPGKPDNVMIGSWIPQRDILAHPNVKVFITHGGKQGTTEAFLEGIPLLGIPVYGDQMMNLAQAEQKGYAINIPFRNITEENLLSGLTELLTNPKYDENAKRLSAIFNDRPLSPKQAVIYWTEYVIRHKGADHLKSIGLQQNYVEFHMIDVYLFLLVVMIVLFYIFYKIFKCILARVFRPSSKKQKTN